MVNNPGYCLFDSDDTKGHGNWQDQRTKSQEFEGVEWQRLVAIHDGSIAHIIFGVWQD
jgi:hypothetical protein